MKKFFAIIFLSTIFLTGCEETAEKNFVTEKNFEIRSEVEMKIKICVGEKIFDATLEDNETTREFLKNLPLEIKMTELNGNEKYFRFNKNFPTADKKISEIHSGDLMLWNSNTLVLFYKNFSTSYSYTRLGKIDNPADLEKILGAENISVKFER